MGHLVASLRDEGVAAVRTKLMRVHEYLTAHLSRTLRGLQTNAGPGFGTSIKRLRVALPTTERPDLVRTDEAHNLTEVINQCAALERLLDGLGWIEQSDRFSGAFVLVCHPSTSSDFAKEDDHDLVLRLADGSVAKFEVSDVISDSTDSNGKEVKDLKTLGVLQCDVVRPTPATTFPSGHLFLIVSEEFGRRLMKPTRHVLKTGFCHYDEVATLSATRIIEIKKGPKQSQR